MTTTETIATPEAPTNEFWIPQDRIEGLQKQIDKLARRAAKLGATPVSITVTKETEERQIGSANYIDPETNRPAAIMSTFVKVIANGERPKFNGWHFVARLIHDEVGGEAGGGSIVKVAPGETLPERFRTLGCVCEHCHRDWLVRRDTYVVAHDDGTYKAVGSGCLADFLGHADPKQLAAYATYFDTVLATFNPDAENEGEDAPEGVWKREAAIFSLKLVIAAANNYAKAFGWVSSKMAEERQIAPSSATLARLLFNFKLTEEEQKEKDTITPTNDDLAWAEKAIAYVSTMPASSDFEYNLQTIAKSGRASYRTFALSCAIVGVYKRHIEGERQASVKRQTSEHYGAVGDKVELTLLVTRTREIEGGYGVTTLHLLTDEEGHSFKWFASGGNALPEGEWLRIKGTIKAHDEYKGLRQTTLTRCKLVPTSEQVETLTALSDDATALLVTSMSADDPTRIYRPTDTWRESIHAESPNLPAAAITELEKLGFVSPVTATFYDHTNSTEVERETWKLERDKIGHLAEFLVHPKPAKYKPKTPKARKPKPQPVTA